MCKVADTGHSIKTGGLGFSARTPKRKSGECGGEGGEREGSFSCITRAGQHSSVPIEQAWLLQPRTMPGTRYCARALLFHRFIPFSFDPRMRYIPRAFDRPNLPMSYPSVDLFLSLIFSLVPLLATPCTSYFALLSIILDRRRRCSRHGRRIDFRLPRSRRRPSQS